jgi:hypothetical protein
MNGFEVIRYQTRNGENCTATKKDGIVTIKGDKSGARQMQLNEFMDTFLKDQANVKLERTPQQDSVNFTGIVEKLQENRNKKSTQTVLGLLNIGALAIGAYILTKGHIKAKAIEEMAGKLGDEVAKPVIKRTTKQATKVTETVTKASETVAHPVTTKAPKVSPAETVAPKVEVPKTEAPKTQKTQLKETAAPKAEEPKYNFAEQESQLSRAVEEVPADCRGSYGQDIFDISDIRNEMDSLSPYYKEPYNYAMDILNPYYKEPYNSEMDELGGLFSSFFGF